MFQGANNKLDSYLPSNLLTTYIYLYHSFFLWHNHYLTWDDVTTKKEQLKPISNDCSNIIIVNHDITIMVILTKCKASWCDVMFNVT